MNNKRLDYITIAKGICIILMVLGHTAPCEFVFNFIYLFHMPLFFFVSGYCFNEKNLLDFKGFATKRIKGLYIPYVKYAIVFLFLHNLFFYIHFYDERVTYAESSMYIFSINDILKELVSIILKIHSHEWFLGGFWFLKELFLGSFIFYFLLKYAKKRELILFILFVLAVVFRWNSPDLPFLRFAKITFLSTLFIALGYFSKTLYSTIRKDWLSISIFGLLTLLAVWICPKHMFSLNYCDIQTYLLFALSGIFFTLLISEKITSTIYLKQFLIYVGNHTMPILALHFVAFKIVSFIYIYIKGDSIIKLAEFPVIKDSGFLMSTSYVIVGLFVPLLFNMILSKRG